jgi:DNA-binding IclR family transcriptional regulator
MATDSEPKEAGPRAILRVPEVLMAVAARRGGVSLAELAQSLALPKTSLHRLLRTLEGGGYLTHANGLYAPGPESLRLANVLGRASQLADFPGCARPVLEGLAAQTGETVMLSVLSDTGIETVYVEVIESEKPLRFTLRVGNRRPLFCTASGKVLLAFSPAETQARYLAQADFLRFTEETSSKKDMPAILERARAETVIFDRNGIVDGASGIASPSFDRDGALFCAVSVAGPTERIEAKRAEIEALVRAAGARLSGVLGWEGSYPPL